MKPLMDGGEWYRRKEQSANVLGRHDSIGRYLRFAALPLGLWLTGVMPDVPFPFSKTSVDSSLRSAVAHEIESSRPADERPPNLIHLHRDWLCGGQPETDAHFAALAAMGVRTLVSVDGARPDIESAAKHSLAYIHIPIGYDGIDEQAIGSLASLSRHLEGKVFIHCHHGRHRGPAAATIAVMAAGLIDQKQAVALLHQAGTDPKYTGLYRDVANFQTPSVDAPLPRLVEIATTSPLVAAMCEMNQTMNSLSRVLNEATSGSHPTTSILGQDRRITAEQLAIVMEEGFRESARDSRFEADNSFVKILKDSERINDRLLARFHAGDFAEAREALQNLKAACERCHAQHRH